MTLNWGHKITIVLILFGVLMTTLVYKSLKTDFQLVSKDYYKDELKYQQVIDGSSNADALSTQLSFVQDANEIKVQFPAEMNTQKIEGEYWFYCAYNDMYDRRIPVVVNGGSSIQLISKKELAAATYTVKTSWKADGVTYYNQQSITLK
jgi:FixH